MGVYDVYSDIMFEICWVFTPDVKISSYSVQPLRRYHNMQTSRKMGTENFILFCPAIAEMLQRTDKQKNRYGKPKYRESLSPDDIAKSHSYIT